MTSRIEDYGFISDLHTGALISRRGSIDWLCFPRFDSDSVFGALLGTKDHGRWLLAPTDEHASLPAPATVNRTYRDSTFILESHWRTDEGDVLVTDFMPIGHAGSSIVRRIEGLTGTVRMHQELELRFGYGKIVPWVRRIRDDHGEALLAIAGPDAVLLRGPALPTADFNRSHVGEFIVEAGQVMDLHLCGYPSHEGAPAPIDISTALEETSAYWKGWASHYVSHGPYGEIVKRSLLVLRALTYEKTGGIVAAPTTSLPEQCGGKRNWDYRFCWLRDAALTLEAMMTHGFRREALVWRNWLLRSIAGDPQDLQIMYGVAGERELRERVLTHLPGYEGSSPVRVGNGAYKQYQGDVAGEVMLALERLRNDGVHEDHFSWPLQRSLLHFVEMSITRKDHGIWEMRGEKMHFTHSRVMMWAALGCGIRAVEENGLEGPAERWKKLRDVLRAEIMELGFNREIYSFTQTYGGTEVDASLLILPQVGFLRYSDDKMLGTVARLEKDLLNNGLLLRYRTETCSDGLDPGEHPFLACSFWLVEQYARTGRDMEARSLMDRLVSYGNDLGLLSEEYDTDNQRMLGNYPQAFTHLALIRAADALNVGN
ncbi:glycoside hydrolase family 15 protein [Arthrobacter globiformis]|uniref:glycoside hydrolase family 15 protein n=1 Tax=Arthrobacter globiformis TaxID=1665 RepID=UPI002781DA4E|nr:glycoside hydrolase family 15 protein [Arthrobacter globiformis]MDQ0867445.1 GH15 family glucan-1,4-alpha-glucosidase [Arthrobacter globiformis]